VEIEVALREFLADETKKNTEPACTLQSAL
jgi:hypothetical protein